MQGRREKAREDRRYSREIPEERGETPPPPYEYYRQSSSAKTPAKALLKHGSRGDDPAQPDTRRHEVKRRKSVTIEELQEASEIYRYNLNDFTNIMVDLKRKSETGANKEDWRRAVLQWNELIGEFTEFGTDLHAHKCEGAAQKVSLTREEVDQHPRTGISQGKKRRLRKQAVNKYFRSSQDR